MNDPVMGGRSTGTFVVDQNTGVGVFDGQVVDVPFLHAPGFIKAATTDGAAFADVSHCSALTITAKSRNAYAGFRVSFGTAHPPEGKFYAYGYKAHFDAPVGDDFQTITIPFTRFSDYWDDATGNLVKTCQDNSKYCPDEATLRNMKTVSIWGEGVAGEIHLEIKSIGASGCNVTQWWHARRTNSISTLLRGAATALEETPLLASLANRIGSSGVKCPGSAAWVHASMEVTVSASASCAKVADEIKARVAGQPSAWHDPHNRGTYTLVSSSATDLELTRKTGDGKYTDKMSLALAPTGADSCTISGCSESQVTSVMDFSTNYCNLRMLYCGTAEGCKPVHADFPVKETKVSPSTGAGKDPSACLKALADAAVPEPAAPQLNLLAAADSQVTLYKTQGAECGQATLDAKYATYAEKFAGLKEGTCASEGFTVADGTKTMKVPVLGNITVSKFKKASTDPLLAAAVATTLVTFDGADTTTHAFKTLNDPVMGGQSDGTWTIQGGVGVFDGNVKTVPKLKAPGFIEAWANDGHFVDASSAGADGDLVLLVRSSTPEYEGFRVTFAAGALSTMFSCSAGGSIIGSRGCFKAKFSVPAGDTFTEVRVPFSSFSDKWSSATGEQTVTCAKDASVCPTAKDLSKIQAIGLWGEGKTGHLHLEVKSISASPAASPAAERLVVPASLPDAEAPSARPPAEFDTCSGPIQAGLRFNISALTSHDLTAPVDVNPEESLATAICCDSRTKVYAEPQFLFSSPYVDLFAHMDSKKPTTFYDSVCGLPLFRAPMNRTLAEFQADTNDHGWPSFRPAEIIAANVRTDANGFVYSKCGTHLGSFLPDEKGDRWCLDTACLAGNPVAPASPLVVVEM